MKADRILNRLNEWLHIGIILTAMDLFYGVLRTGSEWNAHAVVCFSMFLIMVVLKMIEDMIYVRGDD